MGGGLVCRCWGHFVVPAESTLGRLDKSIADPQIGNRLAVQGGDPWVA